MVALIVAESVLLSMSDWRSLWRFGGHELKSDALLVVVVAKAKKESMSKVVSMLLNCVAVAEVVLLL